MSDLGYLATVYQIRDQYLGNAQQAVVAREYRKASELLWGAVTQQLKAVAATYNILISSHREFFAFVRQLAEERQDRRLYTDFVDLNALHKNFYDETIPPDVFPDFYERTLGYIERLGEIVKSPTPER